MGLVTVVYAAFIVAFATTGTSTITPTGSPVSGTDLCADTDSGATNLGGEPCTAYWDWAYYELPVKVFAWKCSDPHYTPYFDDSDFTASDMCCACQGATCVQFDNGATDSHDHSCDDYITIWCGNYDDSDWTASDMCCICGGGLMYLDQTTTPATGDDTLIIALIVTGGAVFAIAIFVWRAVRRGACARNVRTRPEDESWSMDFEFVDADSIKNSQGALPVHLDMLQSGWLRQVRLGAEECLEFTLTYCVALSYVWITRTHPDPEGEQADALRSWLRQNPHITHVWIDWCSLPQGKRTPAEKQKFKLGLANVNLVYLSCYVLKILNSQYSARFWPQYEAWLSYHRFGLDKSDFASDTVSRSFSVFTGWASTDHTEQDKMDHIIKKRWSGASVEEVISRLGHSDVSVTNSGDKPRQFEKIRDLRTRFQTMHQ